MNKANEYLHTLPIITSLSNACNYDSDVLFYTNNAEFEYVDDLIITHGMGSFDEKKWDLVRVIQVVDALNIQYKKTNILTPLVFAESRSYIPWHITTQCFLFTSLTADSIEWIKREMSFNKYQRHELDNFWLPFSKDIHSIKPGERICIFNRRVSGWDGSHEKPVIELLGAGGHLPTIWDKNIMNFREIGFKENIQKEFSEELGGEITDDIVIFGGYKNESTHELVVLCGAKIQSTKLKTIQEYAIQNKDEDTEGIYLGTFKETMEYYIKNPEPFAGGIKAAPYNFPCRRDLMERLELYFFRN